MIEIILRELMDHFKSLRFIVLLLFSIALFSMNGFVFVQRFSKHIDSYNEKTANKYTSTYSTQIVNKPSLLQFITEGGDKYQPEAYNLHPKGWVEPSHITAPNNYIMPDIPDIDWTFIIKVLFSLYVLLLGYDAVSGEKERGTLRLMLSNPLNRFGILFAKYLSILISIFIPLFTGMLLSFIIVMASLPQVLSLHTCVSLVMLCITSLVYLSLFIFLSLMLSSLIHQSSVVLLTLLSIFLVWLLVPEMSFIVSRKLSRVPGEYQIMKQIDSRDRGDTGLKDLMYRIEAGEFETEEEVKAEGSRMLEKLENDLHTLYVYYRQSMKRQSINAHLFARLSPMALFQYAAERMAGTGMKQQENLLSDINAFSPVYDRYVSGKVGKLVGVKKYHRGWNVRFKGKFLSIDSPEPEQYQGDMSDFPVFRESESTFSRTLRDVMLDVSGLFLWNVVLCLGAFVAFLRADVR